MPKLEAEDGSKTKKRRPERQFYVPPAQRRSSLKDQLTANNNSEAFEKNGNAKKAVWENEGKTEKKRDVSSNIAVEEKRVSKSLSEKCALPGDKTVAEDDFSTFLSYLQCLHCLNTGCSCDICDNWVLKFKGNFEVERCFLYRDILGDTLYRIVDGFVSQIPIIQFCSSPAFGLFSIFGKDFSKSFQNNITIELFPFYYTEKSQHIFYNSDVKIAFPDTFENSYSDILQNFDLFCNHNMFLIKHNYFLRKDFTNFLEHQFVWENFVKEKYEHIIITDHMDIELKIQNQQTLNTSTVHTKGHVQNGGDLTRENVNDQTQTAINRSNTKKNGHEEEIEIMRKTKENINRKIRPIMKYNEHNNDILSIEISDVKDWEDLLDEDGELRGELLETVDKSEGTNAGNVKTADSVLSEDIKTTEELEHMVELFDFPSSFKTNDLIQAFSDIKSDAMYIKWVDATHAILVLGSLTQAIKAINLHNPLIKVRPLSVASKISLEVAQRSDLKPAMKRPPTNLQAARRFITAHLGTKIDVSRERMVKESNDLRAAREKKKMTRQNERDAWEGNLKSKMN